MRNRSVIGQLFFIQIVLFRRGMTEQSLNCLGKTPELKDRLTMLVMVGRSAGRSCLRREVGIVSRSQKVLDDWDTSLKISSSVARLKKVRLVGIWLGSVWGEAWVTRDFRAEWILRTLSETSVVCSPQPKPPKILSLSCNMRTMRRCQFTQLTIFKETHESLMRLLRELGWP